jgi:hypothetical protein
MFDVEFIPEDADDGEPAHAEGLSPMDLRWMCLTLAAENRVEGEDWVDVAKKAHTFLLGGEDNVRPLRPV